MVFGRGQGDRPLPWLIMRSADLLKVVLIVATFANVELTSAAARYVEPMQPIIQRPHTVSITEFGAVGDGVTLNTKAFQNAIFYLTSFGDKGGAALFVPAGKWLTGSFGLTSHLTLSLDKDAVIIGSTDSADWPVIDPLPSYGRGRELPGKRHQSLIHGSNLTDVVITGANGTIDGNGAVWWDWFQNKTLNYTRPHVIELMYSTEILISNITIVNSPFWAVHPVYSSELLVQFVTILAPPDSPNTDGIDPDSSTNVRIQDCYIRTGDDVIVIKSGWDEYGITFAHPSHNISIKRIVGEGARGSGISFGSEMSGGISEVRVEELQISNSLHGIRVKTSPGRGGYVKNLVISDVSLTNVTRAISIAGNYGEHPDDNYNKTALPLISNITIQDVTGTDIQVAGILQGIKGDVFGGICLSNITLRVSSNQPWTCSDVQGSASLVVPEICEALSGHSVDPSASHPVNPSASAAIPSSMAGRRMKPLLGAGLTSLSAAAAAAAYSL